MSTTSRGVFLFAAAGLALATSAHGQVYYSGDPAAGAFINGSTSGTVNVTSAATWSYFVFSAMSGDNLNVEVNRLAGGLDPACSIVAGNAAGIPFGSLTGTTIFNWSGPGLSPVLAFGDDEDPAAIPGPFGDPHFSHTTGSTGTYTVAVCSYSSTSSTTVYPFEITVSGVTGGACGLGDGSCRIITGAACASQGGVFHGRGSLCSNANGACNSLSNGGFEVGAFAPAWTQFGNTGFTGISPTVAQSGQQSAFFGPIGTTGGISQPVPVAAGTPMVISFWYQSPGGANQSFAVSLGNLTLVNLVNASGFTSFTEFSIPVIAPTNNPVLRFTFRNDPSFDFLDSVRVCVGASGCYANCDFSTQPPILNVLDFNCFLNKFAAGCP